MRPRTRSTLLLVAILPLITACSGAEAPQEQGVADTAGTADALLAIATEQRVLNARMPVEGIVTAGQPTPEQLAALRAAGVEHFVSLRPATEQGAGWEEADAESAGYGFERLAIDGAGALTRENVEAFAAMMADAGGEATVVYCASSNRVGAMFALKAHWVEGVPAEDALALGRSAGLTSLEAPVRELLGLSSN